VLEIPEYYPIGSNIKKSVDLNLITATNKNLRIMVDDELFRHDLYYRIAVIPITIPPLRERKCDIIPLVEYFLKTEGGNFILSPEAKLKLLGYSWPGNVRELKNVIERSCLLTENGNLIDSIIFDADGYQSSEYSQDHTAYDVPATWQEFKTFKTKVVKDRKEELEKIFIEKLLIKHNGNISECSRSAGIDRRQFQDMIKALNIDVSLFR
jgi:transcriptional regulator with PAS, ATPase and Fis domain